MTTTMRTQEMIKTSTNTQNTSIVSVEGEVKKNNNVQTSTSTQPVFWNIDKPLNTARSNFGSALLANEQVLVAGGLITSSSAISQTEVYTSTGWQLAPAMKLARAYHTVTAFANNTKVLAAGSATTNGLQTAEVYNIVNNTWTFTSNNMSSSRHAHTATLLANGQILIAGGYNASGKIISTAELYIPSSNSFINTTNMNIARSYFTSTLLSDGSSVLVTGGANASNYLISTAELYINGSWILLSSSMTQSRAYHAAVLLNDGTVLVVGGGAGGATAYSTAEIYNATSRKFTAVGSMQYRRGGLTLTLLPSGKVLATGGVDCTSNTYPLVCELYDPVTRTWSSTLMLNHGRSFHQSVLLNNVVLTTDGNDGNVSQVISSEKYNL
ncbi:unnamed protein product [Adineta steineri]|uniref:Kelch repeat protein n=1 Tax=Adineta steineri TaxID=433720 RepID=A0A819D4C0_9BILA|nr:unnamed protein product [Adineta steineri]CAF3822225.1 unnamed protein product [Adineta steineri]